MIRSYEKGHRTYYDITTKTWRYVDTLESVEHNPRPCKKCGCYPTKEGYDPCLGHIKFARAACCGHGIRSRRYTLYPHKYLWNQIKHKLNLAKLYIHFFNMHIGCV